MLNEFKYILFAFGLSFFSFIQMFVPYKSPKLLFVRFQVVNPLTVKGDLDEERRMKETGID